MLIHYTNIYTNEVYWEVKRRGFEVTLANVKTDEQIVMHLSNLKSCFRTTKAKAVLREGFVRKVDIETIRANHYTHSVPSGKSYYMRFGAALVVWSIPANKNIAKFILRFPGRVWELSRLWAPDGHDRNLLTQAISAATSLITKLEAVDALVSYADPNAGHQGGVYRAASWLFHGVSEESRVYVGADGQTISRRAFHSGKKGLTKAEIEAKGFTQQRLPGKIRFIKPISSRARREISKLLDSN